MLSPLDRCLSAENRPEVKRPQEDIRVELIDVINCAWELFIMKGGGIEYFLEHAADKQEKWANNLEKLNGKKERQQQE